YEGASLLSHLEHVNVGSVRNLVDFRMPVQMSIRPHQGVRGIVGQIASGVLRPGEEVVVLPSGGHTRVKRIGKYHAEVDEAIAGDSVLVELEDELDVSRGDMLVRLHNLPRVSADIECMLCWMDEEPLDPGDSYLLQHTTRRTAARVTAVRYRVNMDTLHREASRSLALNDIGRVRIATSEPLFFDPYQINRATAGFILIHPRTNRTVAAGVIKEEARQLSDIASGAARRRSTNVRWEPAAVTRIEREALHGHRAAVVWLTGLSGSGKTTLARVLEQCLVAGGAETFLLDGDNVRHGLNGDLGFSADDRAENVRRVAEVAKLAFEHGAIVICAFISPFARERAFARRLLPPGRFVEVHVRCSLETCKLRDPKGLYAKAERGEIPHFTGVSSPYEEPTSPEIVIDAETMSPQESALAVLDFLTKGHVVAAPETHDGR
ncbi:MAG: adenylyl-sulfate kinase, partial [Vicinamibacterales bacterium]|nr:adenylyl-sulfate kinase [Vicinamibacterales bacterium]